MSADTLLWAPSPQRIHGSQLYAFIQHVAGRYHLPTLGAADDPGRVAATWEALRAWSLAQPGAFWQELLDFVGVAPSAPARLPLAGTDMLDTHWFPGMTLNYARHMLRCSGDEPALLAETELGRQRVFSRDELRAAVARCAAALRRDGVQAGDRVAGYLPNVPETVIAMLAAASLGAVWSSCSPDFGVQGVLDRFGQIAPTVLFAADGYTYNGKPHNLLERVHALAAELPGLRRLVLVPFLDPAATPVAAGPVAACTWDEYLGAAAPPPLTFAEVPFAHPLFIMYSSGTTGAPKCIVHGHGGTLLQHLKELMLHTDVRAGDRVFYFTTCGWMMWNWLVSALGAGAAVVLYEGSPLHPAPETLWAMSARLGLHVFGTSPKYLAACEQAGLQPAARHDLAALRCVCSTGSPLSPEQFRWVYRAVKTDVQLASICGGTDIISCFMLGNPLLPVYPGEIQCRGLGMDVQAWDEQGRSVVGRKGELVCVRPFPSQPVGFWDDADQSKYRAAYFAHYAGVWRHGDFIEITPRGGVIVYGRSDATLNPGGVRIGTAEIYRLVETLPEVVDSLAVPHTTPDNDVEIVLFVVLRAGIALDEPLRQRLRQVIADGATRRHVPRQIYAVPDMPRTLNGKKVELAVAQLLRGEPVVNRDALANPDALEAFRPYATGGA